MERIKPHTLSGFMELLPAPQQQMEAIMDVLRTTYSLYGFTPLDTPAIEAADVVLMDDDPAKIALAMRIARRTKSIVYQNIVFALAIKAACLLLGALGIANMWAAIFADVGVMVLAVLNATRALYTKDLTKK